jgi:hypothetical protein
MSMAEDYFARLALSVGFDALAAYRSLLVTFQLSSAAGQAVRHSQVISHLGDHGSGNLPSGHGPHQGDFQPDLMYIEEVNTFPRYLCT